VSRLIPNIPMDVFKRVDGVVDNANHVIGRVDETLTTVSGTLSEATEVLTEVRQLLIDLRDEMELLQQVPALVTKLDEIHVIVKKLAAKKG